MADQTEDEKLLYLVSEYSTKYFPSGVDAPTVSDRHTSGEFGLKGSWEGTDESAEPGVYVIFSATGKALYIGKSSNTIGSRLVRFRRQGVSWNEVPAMVRMITVKNYFEAPSLEEFLIERLESSFNTVGVGKRQSA